MSVGVQSSASSSTSHTLLARVQKLDPEAWRRFASLYGPVVYRWCLGFGLPSHDAADVAQEVFQSVVKRIGEFRKLGPSDSLRGWLYTVTRNKVRDHFRRHGDEPTAQGGFDAYEQFQQVPDSPSESGESRDAITAELAQRAVRFIQNEFEETTWRAFWGTAVDGRPAADVARDLSISLAAVYKAKSRVLLRLRSELDGLIE